MLASTEFSGWPGFNFYYENERTSDTNAVKKSRHFKKKKEIQMYT